ncbi:MAG: hypothetical protein LBP69_04165, partial [Treponema sp.]|nr:hypothetical protein [Treponema sp.]
GAVFKRLLFTPGIFSGKPVVMYTPRHCQAKVGYMRTFFGKNHTCIDGKTYFAKEPIHLILNRDAKKIVPNLKRGFIPGP